MITSLQYITGNTTSNDVVKQCEVMCRAGVKWVQLRMKAYTQEQVLAAAIKCREITNKYHTKLIINDFIEVVKESDADGVHLGQEDLCTAKAREILGKDYIIGGTANTLSQVLTHIENGVNYVGVGPWRYTKTKKKLSPILGAEGLKEIVSGLKERGEEIPLVAIGGIALADVQKIKELGINHIAVSSLLENATDQSAIIKNIQEIL